MPYCNWCQLESDRADVCVWCKRPFNTGPGVYAGQKTSTLQFLRNEDESDIPVPVFAFIGAVVFVGILVFALVSWKRGAAPAQPTAQNLDWHVDNSAAPNPAPAHSDQGAFLQKCQCCSPKAGLYRAPSLLLPRRSAKRPISVGSGCGRAPRK